jgi:hypothetical protein
LAIAVERLYEPNESYAYGIMCVANRVPRYFLSKRAPLLDESVGEVPGILPTLQDHHL